MRGRLGRGVALNSEPQLQKPEEGRNKSHIRLEGSLKSWRGHMVLDNLGWGTGTLGARDSVLMLHSSVTTQALKPGILGSLYMKRQGAFCVSVKELTGTKEDHQGPRTKHDFLTISQL